MEKQEDCTKQFSQMLDTFRINSIDKRDHPTMQEDIPMPLAQKEMMIEKLKEQRETLEKINADMRQKQTLRSG